MMTDSRQNKNIPAENHSSKKALVVAVSVICALAVLIAVFLVCKNPLYFAIAKSQAEKGNYSSALSLCEKSTSDESYALASYLRLRLDINESYAQLLSEFDIAKINSWAEKITLVAANSEVLGEEISAQANSLSATLLQIINLHSQYTSLRPEIISSMDVFAEFNRLYSVDSNGKNTAFTVMQELVKISDWEQKNAKLSAFASMLPGSENIYLLNYLIKEIQGECGDLRNAMDAVLAMGYTQTDNIRLSGTGQKKFPGVQNANGETITVLEKERYEAFLYVSICRKLAEILGTFYSA